MKVSVQIGYSFQIVRPAIMLPRIEGGVDHGVDRKLLVRVERGERYGRARCLVWQPGAKHWMGLMAGYTYSPGFLAVTYVGSDMDHARLDAETTGETKLFPILNRWQTQDWIKLHLCEQEHYNMPASFTAELMGKLDWRASVIVRPGTGRP